MRVTLVVRGARCGVRQTFRYLSVDDLNLRPVGRRDVVLPAERFVAWCSGAACQCKNQHYHRGAKLDCSHGLSGTGRLSACYRASRDADYCRLLVLARRYGVGSVSVSLTTESWSRSSSSHRLVNPKRFATNVSAGSRSRYPANRRAVSPTRCCDALVAARQRLRGVSLP